MLHNRRTVMVSGGALAFLGGKAEAIQGIFEATAADKAAAKTIADRLRAQRDYVGIMMAMSNLDKTAPWSTGPLQRPALPYNKRWTHYANPLLVLIWQEMGYNNINDCASFCGVTLGWALKQSGRKPPPDCESSQS